MEEEREGLGVRIGGEEREESEIFGLGEEKREEGLGD